MDKLPTTMDEALASPEHRKFLITLMGQARRGMIYNESNDYSKAVGCLCDIGIVTKSEVRGNTVLHISRECVQSMLDKGIIKRGNVPIYERHLYKNNMGRGNG